MTYVECSFYDSRGSERWPSDVAPVQHLIQNQNPSLRHRTKQPSPVTPTLTLPTVMMMYDIAVLKQKP